MRRREKFYSKKLLTALLILVIALVAAQCGAAPTPDPAPAPAEEEAAEPAEEVVEEEVAEEEPAVEEEAEEAAAEEEAVAEEEEAAAAEEEPAVEEEAAESNEVAEDSQASQAEQLSGVTVVSDEDISTPRSAFGGEYRDVSTSDAVSFHPYQTTDTASSGYQGLVYDGSLLRLDENTLEYIPHMAESYTISEDGLTFTFKLRQDMQWTDGEPITANDYKWTYDQVIDPANEFPYLSQLGFITSYEALDDYTLEVKIDEIYAPALGQMSGLVTPLPKHIWENLDWSDPETNPEINNPTVTSGSYKLAEWERDQFVIFEANENWWYKGAPNITQQILEIVPDQDIAYEKMKANETDTGPITPENLEEARQLENITLYEWWPAAARWSYIGLNHRDGFVTSDVNVRQGLAYAIDKQLLTDEVMLGQAKRLCSAFPETSWVYNPDVPCYDYDTDKALEKFAEAGYTLEGDVMVDESGDPLTLKLVFGPNTSQTRELMALTVQDYLGEIGIEVEIEALEWSSFLDAIHSDEPDWDLSIGGWRATIEPHIMFTIFAEESIPNLNSGAYINKEVEQLFAEGGATYDTEIRKEKYGQVQQTLAEEVVYIFLFYNKSWSGQNNRIQGIDPKPLGLGWNSEDWFIEEDPGN